MTNMPGNVARTVRDRYAVTTAANHRHIPHHSMSPHSTTHQSATHHSRTVDTEYVGKPNCEKCGTDEFIYLESFIPPKYRHDGAVRTLGEVAYTCTRCEDFSAHSVPASWAPPGWYLG
ncbi:hypothetical protein [Arthrobacter sp. ISL-5]|uniref:hypothetical protein n=1 Tax=Arthrobacter sp. ISL-5 TaxID=2819111 RepID=UPI0035A9762F